MKIYKTKKDTSVIFIWTLKKQTEIFLKKCFLIFREQNRIKIHSKLNQVTKFSWNHAPAPPSWDMATIYHYYYYIFLIQTLLKIYS